MANHGWTDQAKNIGEAATPTPTCIERHAAEVCDAVRRLHKLVDGFQDIADRQLGTKPEEQRDPPLDVKPVGTLETLQAAIIRLDEPLTLLAELREKLSHV